MLQLANTEGEWMTQWGKGVPWDYYNIKRQGLTKFLKLPMEMEVIITIIFLNTAILNSIVHNAKAIAQTITSKGEGGYKLNQML